MKEVKLKDVTTKIGSGATPRGGKNSYKDEGISLIRSLNVYDLEFDKSGLAFIDEEQADGLSNVTVEPDDVLLNITGASVARCCKVPKDILPARVNQHVSIIRADNSELNPDYLQYLLVSPSYKHKLLTYAQIGATREALTKGGIEDFKIDLPPIETQKKIASILSAFDDLIENNTRRIAILEEMARLIYREWFVHYRYPGHENDRLVDSGTELGEVPEGWEIGTIGDLYDVKSGFAFKSKKLVDQGSFGVIKIGNIQNGEIDVNGVQFLENDEVPDRAAKFKLHPGDVLIAMTGAKVGKVGIMPKTKNPYYLNQRVGKYFGKSEMLKSHLYLYTFLNSREAQVNIEHLAQGAAQPNISATDLKSLKLPIPLEQVLNEFEHLTLPMRDEILTLRQKNVKLREIRDLLLPMLISGSLKN